MARLLGIRLGSGYGARMTLIEHLDELRVALYELSVLVAGRVNPVVGATL